MDIRFECIYEGKSLFQVFRRNAESPLFTGTMAQCRRFLDVYEAKLRKTRRRDRASLARRLPISS